MGIPYSSLSKVCTKRYKGFVSAILKLPDLLPDGNIFIVTSKNMWELKKCWKFRVSSCNLYINNFVYEISFWSYKNCDFIFLLNQCLEKTDFLLGVVLLRKPSISKLINLIHPLSTWQSHESLFPIFD